jgi:hypothetical protein
MGRSAQTLGLIFLPFAMLTNHKDVFIFFDGHLTHTNAIYVFIY